MLESLAKVGLVVRSRVLSPSMLVGRPVPTEILVLMAGDGDKRWW